MAWALLVVGLCLWPLLAVDPAGNGVAGVPHDGPPGGGLGAPPPPILHASGPLAATALGAAPDPAPPVAAVRPAAPPRSAGAAGAVRAVARRSRAQRLYGRRNLDGG